MPAPARFFKLELYREVSTHTSTLVLDGVELWSADWTPQTFPAQAGHTITLRPNDGTIAVAAGTAANALSLTDGTPLQVQFTAATPSSHFWLKYDVGAGNTLDGYYLKIGLGTGTTGSVVEWAAAAWVSDDGVTWALLKIIPQVGIVFGAQPIHSLYDYNAYLISRGQADLGGPGGIFGIVSENGLVKRNSTVLLYENNSYTLVGRTLTDEYGGYQFLGLNTETRYLVMAIDLDGDPPKNAIVYDGITPIDARSRFSGGTGWKAARRFQYGCAGWVNVRDTIVNSQGEGFGLVYSYDSGNPDAFMTWGTYPDAYTNTLTTYPPPHAEVEAWQLTTRMLWKAPSGLSLEQGFTLELYLAPGATDYFLGLGLEWMSTGTAGPVFSTFSPNNIGRGYDREGYFHLSKLFGGLKVKRDGTVQWLLSFAADSATGTWVTAGAALPLGALSRVTVTYKKNTALNLTVNGMTTTRSLAGRGDPYDGWCSSGTLEQWTDPTPYVTQTVGFLGLWSVNIAGYPETHTVLNTYTRVEAILAHVACYRRALTAQELSDLEGIWSVTEPVLTPTMSGWAGEVEVDCPCLWWPMQSTTLVLNQTVADVQVVKPFKNMAWPTVATQATCDAMPTSGFKATRRALAIQSLAQCAAAWLSGFMPSRSWSLELFVRIENRATTANYWLTVQTMIHYNPYNPSNYDVALLQLYSTPTGTLCLALRSLFGAFSTKTFTGFTVDLLVDYHLIMVNDVDGSGDLLLYVNGALAVTLPAAAMETAGGACRVTLGNHTKDVASENYCLKGKLADWVMYPHALSAERVLAHYQAG